jgi:hypothetical protein
MTKLTYIVLKYRVPLLVLAIFLLVWPVAVDGEALGHFFFRSDNDPGALIAFTLKVISLIAGGVLISLRIDNNRFKNWQLWTLRLITIALISGVFFVITSYADFSRDFVW